MKKFISTVLALSMAASLAACGGSASTAASTESTAASAAEATADSDLAYIKNKGKMTIGYTVYEPMTPKLSSWTPRASTASGTA